MLDTEESFSKTPYEAIKLCRSAIREHSSTNVPCKKIPFSNIIVGLFGSKKPEGVVHFGFVYSRSLKQYFLFVDQNANHYFNRLFGVMKIFLITENKLHFLRQYNIILSAHVYYPPSDPEAAPSMVTCDSSTWYCFKRGQVDDGTEGFTDEGLTVDGLIKSMDSSWEDFVMLNGIKTSD